ncbi:MAG: glutaredoxin 3 [Cycloclasticus pugetii]|jgi:glutaredoxin 3|uniref:Glutaredoxin n=1 Tax=Cycloclasticus zancles 78-ME TaxID=1198232 RepID=S5TAC1_9GAMM|nr:MULTISPECIES: glutaredoxin 3 [Cycloclasticus]AGS40549.1 Glutaredoxin 3 [Cycloclasticus zancles 78-ME]ATI03977.1 glutaredoxin 3 [Cycloclasticus sp. PY97N]MBV1898697.1 glutaredoxin 3 [Cycloclasticus sp.]MDF1829657.1 glutaredoxin 3 [Cycloclasticus pugetii]PHR51649.1 MAG: glutaredoxin 3 [Cycloclasticus sp.]|tara:strand:- start:3449 stop:3700 length:252 start_codon:yes stop_codon:yes gene_type:complete
MSKITIYTSSLCPYCTQAKRLLNNKNIPFTEISIANDPNKRAEMIQKSQRSTVPQIFNGDKHVGDCTEIYDLESRGKLDELLA